MSGIKQQARVMAAVQADMAPFNNGLAVATDAWRAVDRLAQLSPAEIYEQRGVVMALQLKLSKLIEVQS